MWHGFAIEILQELLEPFRSPLVQSCDAAVVRHGFTIHSMSDISHTRGTVFMSAYALGANRAGPQSFHFGTESMRYIKGCWTVREDEDMLDNEGTGQ
ncbi:hypothetical protein R1CP_40440 (plasmid) [Rhodococcus opacus]|uniref:Uncharacterized protein n=1 Tax=Rhodococcus opacus TaxID=37919 RepID=A0A1B1KJ83_RHOOP|nr:hypothetical protein R1CP_40440 [Rhodococcus opacus]